MAGKLIIYKSDRWLRQSILLAIWVLSFVSFVIICKNNGVNTLYNRPGRFTVELSLPKNHTGALSYQRRDPKANGRLLYSVSLKSLRAENNKLGIFKTALHKVVRIDELRLEFHRYSAPSTTQDSSSEICVVPENMNTNMHSVVKEISRRVTEPIRGWRVSNIDLGNISEILVDGFDYKVVRDGNMHFVIESSRAMVSYKRPGIVLRGRVTIKRADGSTLKSSYVEWEVEEQRFTAMGAYVLERNGVRTTGKGICVDTQLNRIESMHTKLQPREEDKCHARL